MQKKVSAAVRAFGRAHKAGLALLAVTYIPALSLGLPSLMGLI